MTQPAKGQEPSMEEILASIRRIIADEEPAKDTTERRHESLPAAREGAAAPRETAPRPTPPPRPALDERGLLSAATTAAVDAAFDTLARTAQARGGRTLEEVVSELLRPMLKSWLDENLPEMVERLVRAEIERVSRGRG